MGYANEMMIEEHNNRMESDADCREQVYDNEREYHESMLAAIELEKREEKQTEWFSDYRLAHDGYEEFICDLCYLPNITDFPHSECCDREQAWADAASDDLRF